MAELAKVVKNLEKLIDEDGEPHEIRSLAERVLSLQPTNLLGLQCKAVSCMYQDKYGAALQVLDRMETAHKESKTNATFIFQKAYCHYRLSQYTEAKSALEKCPQTERTTAIKNLLAQIYYNEEAYDKAAEVFQALLEGGEYRDEQEKTELFTNYTAALAMQKESGRTVAEVIRDVDDKTADLIYNYATAMVETKDGTEGAMKSLVQAEGMTAQEHKNSKIKTIQSALALSSEERRALLGGSTTYVAPKTPERKFFDNVCNIWAQMAYVYCQMKQEEKAAEILNFIMENHPTSGTVSAITAVNQSAVSPQKDFFESLKRLKAAQHSKYLSRLTSRQIMAIHYNVALLYFRAGSLNSCRKEVERMEKLSPTNTLTLTMRLVLAVKDSRKKQSDVSVLKGIINKYVEEAGDGSTYVQLVAAQIFLENNDLPNAIAILSGVAEIRAKPSTTTTLFSWMVQTGAEDKAMQLLDAYLQSSTPDDARAVLAWSVEFLLRRQQHQLAANYLKEVVSKSGSLANDSVVTSLLALSLSYSDVEKAREMAAKLQSTKSLVHHNMTDTAVEQLEAQVPSRTALEDIGYRRVTVTEEKKKTTSRRRRAMRRPPKSMEGKLDPERWLPMAVRSYVKDLPPKRKREMKRQRALEQEQKRKQAQQRKREAAETKTSAAF